MASNIDPNKPTSGQAKTADVRANFAAAKAEIEALQAGKQDADALLSAIAALNTAADKLMYFIDADQVALTNLTPAARAMLALTGAADRLPYFTGASTAALATLTAFARSLLDDPDAQSAQQTLTFPAPTANTYLRRNSGNTAYEAKTPQQVADELAALRSWSVGNILINGDFDFWQRGTSFAGPGYWADRWRGDVGGGATITRQEHTLGSSPGQPRYYLRHARTTAATSGNVVLAQRIEDVRTHAGETVTVSIECACSVNKQFNVMFLQNFGTGGTPSNGVETANQTLNVTTTRQVHTFTFSLPSIAGKTLGTNNDSYLELRIVEDSSFSTFTLDVFRVKVEPGSVATPFVRRPLALELALAQRYYEKSFPINTAPVTNVGSVDSAHSFAQIAGQGAAQHVSAPIVFKTRKRAVPTIIFYNPLAANDQVRSISAGLDCSATVLNNANETSVFFQYTSPSGAGGPGNWLSVHWTADAEL